MEVCWGVRTMPSAGALPMLKHYTLFAGGIHRQGPQLKRTTPAQAVMKPGFP